MPLNDGPETMPPMFEDLGGHTDGEAEVEQVTEVVLEAEQINHQGSVRSKKEKEVIVYDNQQFWKDKIYRQKVYWRCVKCDSDGCRARLHTKISTGEVVKVVGIHNNHGTSATALSLRELSQQVKVAAARTMEHPSTIFNNVLTKVSQAVQAKLDKSAIRKVVQRKRKRENCEPEMPDQINFMIPDAYKVYRFGLNETELFLLGDSIDVESNRILLFGRATNKNWSAQMKVVFMDGTFKITPSPFYQVYVILAERDGYVFPVLYALLVNKSRSTYERLLNMIKQLWPDFSPTSVSVDYEMAMISALEVCFPETEIWGCLFHLVQNMKKNLAKHVLKNGMITAMAFVKTEDVMPVFEELCDFMPDELEPILDWMQKNYIGTVSRREVFIAPRFAHSLWNVHERTLIGAHRTNNYAEAANHRIQCELDVCHPGIWKFIDALRVVQQEGIKHSSSGRQGSVRRQSVLNTLKPTAEFSLSVRVTRKEAQKNF